MPRPKTAVKPAHALALCVILALALLAALVLAACGEETSALPPLEAQSAASSPSSASTEAASSQLVGGGLPPGCTCHSDDRRKVAMHELFSPQDCAKCHSENENVMAGDGGSRPWTGEHLEELRERMRSEAICLECHKSAKPEVPARYSVMKGRLFCPEDGELYAPDDADHEGGEAYCPTDGSLLVDVDAVTAASMKEPDNRHCTACHPQDDELAATHNDVFAAAPTADPDDCLSCHTSHSDCASCHH